MIVPDLHPNGTRASLGTQRLRGYLLRRGEAVLAFARRAGLSHQLVFWYCQGRGSPKDAHAEAIEKATVLEVPRGAWRKPWRGPKPQVWGMGRSDGMVPAKARAR